MKRLFVAMLGLAWLFGCVAKRNRQCAKSVGSIATKSMTVKNGGNTIDAVEGLALWVSHCISRACALAGWVSCIFREGLFFCTENHHYRNQSLSLPYWGIPGPEKYGAISAIISGYLMVTGKFCWDRLFQYIRLN